MLAANELVGPLFREGGQARQAMAAVRGLLRTAASDLLNREHGQAAALRRHAILTRCDLEGEPHKRVAADLGLSMRQFYRERRAMTAWLAECLSHRLGASRNVVASTIDVSTLELARARALQYGGYSDLALVLLRSVAESATEPATAIAAGCQYVSVLLEHNEFEQSREQLDVLDRYVNDKGFNVPGRLEAQRVALERRNLYASAGDEFTALQLDRREHSSIVTLALSEDRPAQEFALNALTYEGRRLFMYGHFAEAKSALQSARDVLAALRDQTPANLEVTFWILYGALLATTCESLATASRAFLDASALAARHGASELTVLAAIGSSIDEQMRGEGVMALKRVREALPLAEKVASPLNYAHLCLRIAELQIADGDIPAARTMLRDAAQDLVEGTYGWTYLTLLEAQGNLAVRDYAAAKHCAERAITAASLQQNGRVQGVALRALAESYTGLNARSAAVEAIEAAIEKLEQFGYPHALAAAYNIAAKLTGRQKYIHAAQALSNVLKLA